MSATNRKPGIIAMCLSPLLLLFGIVMSAFGWVALHEWRYEQVSLVACGALWILCGPAIVACALWLLGSLGRSITALRIGGIAIVASGTVLVAAAVSGALPCSGPS
jgi:hypothetical protein